MDTHQKTTFSDLKCNEFVYEIRKDANNVSILKWKFRGLDNFGRPEQNYYGLQVIDPEDERPDEVLMVHKNSFKKTTYKSGHSIYVSNRFEAVAIFEAYATYETLLDVSKTKKELFWKPGNIIVTHGDLNPEFYVIREDGFAYPCNKSLDDTWWKKLSPADYDSDLQSTLPANVRMYWDVESVYSPVNDSHLDMSMWTSGNIGETSGGLFYSFTEDRAFGINNDGSFLEKETYDSNLKCAKRNRTSWDFVRIYSKNINFNNK